MVLVSWRVTLGLTISIGIDLLANIWNHHSSLIFQLIISTWTMWTIRSGRTQKQLPKSNLSSNETAFKNYLRSTTSTGTSRSKPCQTQIDSPSLKQCRPKPTQLWPTRKTVTIRTMRLTRRVSEPIIFFLLLSQQQLNPQETVFRLLLNHSF